MSTDPATGVDLTNPTEVHDFLLTGSAADFEMFEAALAIADSIRSFDLTFITGGALDAMGALYVDDVSVALASAPILPGDCNDDGVVDAADYIVWRKNLGGASLANEVATPGVIDEADYDVWRTAFGSTSGSGAGELSSQVPEPSSLALLLLLAAFIGQSFPHRRVSAALNV